MKKFVFVAPEFHSIPPNYAAAVEWWIYNVAKISQANNLIICKGERTEKTVERISEYATIHRIHTSAIYKRFFRKWSRLDPYPYAKRVIDIVMRYQSSDDEKPILIIQNSISLYNSVKQFYPEKLMVLHLHNKHKVVNLGPETKLITPSYFLADFFHSEAKIENIKVVPNGIDRNLYKQEVSWKREHFGLRNNETVILYAGRLDKGKGVIELMDAVNLLHKKDQNIKLFLVGEYETVKKGEREVYRKKVLDKAARMAGGCILAGSIPPADMHQVYPLADLTVVPSLGEEAFCMVALESMACGIPVLVSPRGGIKEFVIPENTGFLLQEPLSPESIAKDISDTLLRNNLNIVAEHAKKTAMNQYDWSNVSVSLSKALAEWF
ncbi:glycosyltransferase [Xenorhabdus griffiniae]|uniref:Glycosyltransferase n=1 Tax=Xenorhabdus griffiniae TaxID=351672 RepID=A0ABY9XHK3_9GAMM|nr:glycosyltransferase [Xenorhabdus griffiniae]MBD1228161.1 glycosyltransferase [Xenorhabdus griffiniae]MBE8587937.1 glycosyltransferase [Xenorhabdus griffiniae]WMV72400.1 glycosyltransferase [Xenorhabdus griffiniae]WNH02078.1 glycosyltransferase [Xenorhabdus griffiniae]